MKANSRWFLLISVLLAIFGAVGFLVITLIVRADLLRQLDFTITVKLQLHIPRTLDEMSIWFGTLAKFQIIVPTLIVVLCLFRRWLVAMSSLVLLFIAHLLEIVGKTILFQPPPPFMFYRHPTEFIFPDTHTFNESSYPSGHSMRVVFVAMTLSLLVWQQKRLPLLVKLLVVVVLAGVTCATMITRVSLGEHWTSDVIGGACLGILIGGCNWALMAKKSSKELQLTNILEEKNS